MLHIANKFWVSLVNGKQVSVARPPYGSVAVSTSVAAMIAAIVLTVAVVGYVAVYNNNMTTGASTNEYTSTGNGTQQLTSSNTSHLILFSADAYANESLNLEEGFATQTGIRMATPVVAGSSTLAANICAGEPVSVFISVSRTSVGPSGLCSEFPGWAIAFAGDQMGLAYSKATLQTAAGKSIIDSYNIALTTNSTKSWFDFFNNLTSGSVKLGISNPNTDPAGFRGWIVLELAGLAFSNNNSGEQYFVNRTLSNEVNISGASAATLLPALDTGQIQFLFIYKSDIAAEGLSLIQLPNSVNLGLPSYNSLYSQATYNTNAGIQKGSAIVLWLSVPKDSIGTNNSVDFVAYTIRNYQSVLNNFRLVPITPAELYSDPGYSIPTPIEALVRSGILTDMGPI